MRPLKHDVLQKKNIEKFANILNNKKLESLYKNNTAQNLFTAFYDFFSWKTLKIFSQRNL